MDRAGGTIDQKRKPKSPFHLRDLAGGEESGFVVWLEATGAKRRVLPGHGLLVFGSDVDRVGWDAGVFLLLVTLLKAGINSIEGCPGEQIHLDAHNEGGFCYRKSPSLGIIA